MEREGLRTPPERKECKENDEWVFFMGPGFTLIIPEPFIGTGVNGIC